MEPMEPLEFEEVRSQVSEGEPPASEPSTVCGEPSPCVGPRPLSPSSALKDAARKATPSGPSELPKRSGEAMEPSRVLHLRNLPPGVLKHEFEDVLMAYGVEESVKVRGRDQALVQMRTLEGRIQLLPAESSSQPCRTPACRAPLSTTPLTSCQSRQPCQPQPLAERH